MSYWGIFVFLFGCTVFGLSYTRWCRKGSEKAAKIVGLLICVVGISVLAFDLLEMEIAIYFVISCVAAFPLVLFGGYGIILAIQAKYPITGTMLGIAVDTTRGKNVYYPIFKYNYNHRQYTELTNHYYSLKCLDHYQEHNQYTIFINPQNPQDFTLKKKIHFSDVFMVLTGIFIFIIPFQFIFK